MKQKLSHIFVSLFCKHLQLVIGFCAGPEAIPQPEDERLDTYEELNRNDWLVSRDCITTEGGLVFQLICPEELMSTRVVGELPPIQEPEEVELALKVILARPQLKLKTTGTSISSDAGTGLPEETDKPQQEQIEHKVVFQRPVLVGQSGSFDILLINEGGSQAFWRLIELGPATRLKQCKCELQPINCKLLGIALTGS
ncbi:unnamed protein product [Protopolystoma xenopodis]|uniref:Uncharacterized protein n=1 Tax=Protopolystoma xenopodis TaxID=117903 RepID=A0A448X5Z1_9PLAT|nr:unnamed protein product [Protopolystoma xenopodis]